MLIIGKERAISRKDLNLIPVPKRPETKYWQGIQHGKLATAIVAEAKSRHLDVTQEAWCVSQDRQRMLGVLTFGANQDLFPEIPKEASAVSFSLGVRHSNMGHYAVSFCVGGTVGVCTNGMFSGEYVLKQRHTKDLDLDAMIRDGFDHYLEKTQCLADQVSSYLSCPIDDKDAAYAIMRLVSNTTLKNRYADDVWREWLNPKHEEFADRNLWTFYNAMTEVAKGMTPDIQYRLISRAKPILQEIFLN